MSLLLAEKEEEERRLQGCRYRDTSRSMLVGRRLVSFFGHSRIRNS